MGTRTRSGERHNARRNGLERKVTKGREDGSFDFRGLASEGRGTWTAATWLSICRGRRGSTVRKMRETTPWRCRVRQDRKEDVSPEEVFLSVFEFLLAFRIAGVIT